MERSLLHWIALCITCLPAISVQADSPTIDNLLKRKRWVRFVVILGRITAINPRYSTCNTSHDQDGTQRRESLSLQVESGTPSLSFSQVDEREQFTMRINRGNDVHITHVIGRSSPSQALSTTPTTSEESPTVIVFRQPPRGNLKLIVERNGKTNEMVAADLWHLLMRYPTQCQRYVIPMLGALRSDWQLSERAARIQLALFSAVDQGICANRDCVAKLINQLDAPTFRERQNADRALRELGQSILCYLDNMGEKKLSREQRVRLRRIRTALVFHQADTPELAASWLVDRPEVWLGYLQSQDLVQRRRGVKQLGRLLGKKIDFDVSAGESMRAAQVAQIRLLCGN